MTTIRVCIATLVVALSSGARTVCAQDTAATRIAAGTPITLADAIRIALTQNSAVRFARNATVLDSLTVRGLRNQFLPNLSASSQSSQVFDVASDFLNLITGQEQVRVQTENLAAQQQELTQLEAFTKAGTRPIGDLYQRQAAVAATRLALANARHTTELAKVDLIQELLLDPRGDYTFTTPTPRDTKAAIPTFNMDSL